MRAFKASLSIAIVATAVWLIDVQAISLYKLNLTKRHVYELTRTALNSEMMQPFSAYRIARANLQRLEPFRREFPFDPELHALRAANLRLIGRNDDAVEAYVVAIDYHPSAELYRRLAETQIMLGQTEQGLQNFRSADAIDPKQFTRRNRSAAGTRE